MTYTPPSPTTFETFTDEEGREFAAVFLQDRDGNNYEARVEIEDWRRAVAVSPIWSVVKPYEVPQVIATNGSAVLHPQRTYRDGGLYLKNLIMQPPYRETVRFIDGNTLNCRRSNLVVRPKGARTIPTKRELEETAFNEGLRAAFAEQDAAKKAAEEAAKPMPRDIRAANLAAIKAFNAAPAAGGSR